MLSPMNNVLPVVFQPPGGHTGAEEVDGVHVGGPGC